MFNKIKDTIFKIKDYDRLEHDYSAFLCYVTDGMLSKTNYKLEGLYTAIDDILTERDEQTRKEAEKDIGWHSVEEFLPEVDEEVIVLEDILVEGSLKVGFGKIAFGHIVDKNIAVDYNGWNIPGVRYWMPCPKIPNND